jgi:hypothetical protein
MSSAARMFPFVQFEFTHALGPAPGRYVVSDEADAGARDLNASDVLLLDVAGAPTVQRRRRRRAERLDPAAGAAPVTLALVTHVRAARADDGADGACLVQACEAAANMQAAWIEEGLALVNLAVRAHRASCGDPYFPELTASDPRVVRIGYGAASEVAAGRWEYAFAVDGPRAPRLGYAERNAPAEVVAAALGGRPVLLQADELVLRALVDLDHGRLDCAALQLHAAARMLAVELAGVADTPSLATSLQALPGVADRLGRATAELPLLPDVTEAQLQEAATGLRRITNAYRAEVLDRFRPGR